MLASVVIEYSVKSLNKVFDYKIPDEDLKDYKNITANLSKENLISLVHISQSFVNKKANNKKQVEEYLKNNFPDLATQYDISVLKEKCGYVSFIGPRRCKKVDKVDTVFDHLETIAKYLINNIASDTGCLRTLFGDWNDAIDGLGTSEDGSSEYGTGVSVMATFHLYKNLQEMIDICKIYKKDYSLYHQTKETLYENIMNTALFLLTKKEELFMAGVIKNLIMLALLKMSMAIQDIHPLVILSMS